jgi:hypothetical protein
MHGRMGYGMYLAVPDGLRRTAARGVVLDSWMGASAPPGCSTKTPPRLWIACAKVKMLWIGWICWMDMDKCAY